jgi:hypothetical protein
MLNELRDLARSLKGAGIAPGDWHSKFKTCPKYGAFRIYPSIDGMIEAIEPLNSDQLAGVRKWEANNGESFPVFNIPPLYEADDAAKKRIAEIKKKLKGNAIISPAEIEEAIKLCNPWDERIKKNTETKVNNCLNRTADDVKGMLGEVPKNFAAISDLIERAKKITFDALYKEINQLAVAGLSEGKTEFMDLLFKKGANNVQFILELRDWMQKGYEYPATHREVQKWMNLKFLVRDQKNLGNAPSCTDAFGEDGKGKDKQKYPEVKLPMLGIVKLRSMFRDIPAQMRYGMIEADSFPAGDKVRKEMKSALEWLSDPMREGKTWRDLTDRVSKASLLFAYPTAMPESLPEMAGLLAGTDVDSQDADGALFSAIAERVTGALKGIATSWPDSEVRIFVLAKMDKARTKVIASRRYATRYIIDSADHWQAGCRNIPVIKIRRFGKKKGETLWCEPFTPFPAELPWCLNTAWLRNGADLKAVHGYSIDDALCLLLDDDNEMRRLANRAIDTIVRNSSSLILAVGQENHYARVFKINQKYSKQALLLPSILGLLLYKLGCRKGGYMGSTAFLVGRFMSLADKLHLKYCENVRKGSVPPQLVGNALMPTALEEPVKALSMLSQRILPYQAWANTLREGDDVGLVRYFLGQLGELSEKLKGSGIPRQCTDAEKAQMLLGYLAWSEKAGD